VHSDPHVPVFTDGGESSTPAGSGFIELEDGSGFIELEDGSGFIELE
jgi:hypothetical protein